MDNFKRQIIDALLPRIGWHATFALLLVLMPVLAFLKMIADIVITLAEWFFNDGWAVVTVVIAWLTVANIFMTHNQWEETATHTHMVSGSLLFALAIVLIPAILFLGAVVGSDISPAGYVRVIKKNMPERRKRKSKDDAPEEGSDIAVSNAVLHEHLRASFSHGGNLTDNQRRILQKYHHKGVTVLFSADPATQHQLSELRELSDMGLVEIKRIKGLTERYHGGAVYEVTLTMAGKTCLGLPDELPEMLEPLHWNSSSSEPPKLPPPAPPGSAVVKRNVPPPRPKGTPPGKAF